MRLSWTREEVDAKLKASAGHPRRCYKTAKDFSQPTNYVMGANIAGFVKVADSMIDQGVV